MDAAAVALILTVFASLAWWRNWAAEAVRSALFNGLFLAWTAKSIIVARLLACGASERTLDGYVRYWARGVRALMAGIAGIKLEVRGRAYAPLGGPSLIAGKHQSWADGIMMATLVPGLAAIAHKGLVKYPLLGPLLQKLKVILVDTCGAEPSQLDRLAEQSRMAKSDGRNILIYPEGRLVPVGEAGRYRGGIFRLYEDLQLPVVPVATNLGHCWRQNHWRKRAGTAIVEFLEPIAPGLSREAFMAELQRRIETKTRLLEAEAA